MLVGGPNARTDYHINTTPEWFYQYRGSMLLKIISRDPSTGVETPHDITIGEGEMYLLEPNTPHNPVRFADTVGVVVELARPAGAEDKLRWYCQGCGEKVYEAAFECRDLGTQIKAAVKAFEGNVGKRTCGNCGEVCDVVPKAKPES